MWHLTRELQRSRMDLFAEFFKKFSLTQQQVRILLQINNLKKTTLTELAGDLGINPGNLSKTCKELEDDGFIKRVRHKEDKRVWTIELDEKGTEVVELVIDHIRKVFFPHSRPIMIRKNWKNSWAFARIRPVLSGNHKQEEIKTNTDSSYVLK